MMVGHQRQAALEDLGKERGLLVHRYPVVRIRGEPGLKAGGHGVEAQ